MLNSTAGTIADKIGADRLEVAKELNRMHSDAIVEREKREGGGSGYLNWLSHADAVEKLESAIGTPTMQAPPDPIPTSPAVETKPEVSKEDPSAYVLKIAELEAKLETSRAEVDAITKQCDEFGHENKSLKSKCSDLQIQLDEFEERQRFEMWFKSRPEFTSQPSQIKEAMWESWLFRSKNLDVEFV